MSPCELGRARTGSRAKAFTALAAGVPENPEALVCTPEEVTTGAADHKLEQGGRAG